VPPWVGAGAGAGVVLGGYDVVLVNINSGKGFQAILDMTAAAAQAAGARERVAAVFAGVAPTRKASTAGLAAELLWTNKNAALN